MPIPALTTLATGLSGAIGSHFNPSQSALLRRVGRQAVGLQLHSWRAEHRTQRRHQNLARHLVA